MQSWLRQLLRLGTGHDSALWPVLLLLLVVLIPSAGVVWMMRAAMENERLAVRQRLTDAYQAQLELAHRHIDERWRDMLARLDAIIAGDSPPRAFAESVTANLVDSVILLDENAAVVYPDGSTAGMVPGESNDAWRKAEYLEFDTQDPPAAAEAYRAIAASTADPLLAARARQAQARVLARAGDRAGAIQVLLSLSHDTAAVDASGRSLAADAELRLIELLDRKSDEWRQTVASLAKRLNDYDFPMPAEQRRFLMHAMSEADPTIAFKTLSAEDLAADAVSQQLEHLPPDILRPTKLANTFQVRSPSGRVIALINGSTLRKFVDGVLAEQPFPKGVVAEMREPGQAETTTGDVVDLSLAPLLPGWRLSLNSGDPDSLDAAANERMAFFLWTGVVVVAITAALALLVANMLRAQARLARLKNDLVATVSHELKTPLASIRLLVDTLLDEDHSPAAPLGNPERVREYLAMISKENSRLSRLIDNFLTFSRMERGKHRFDFQPTDAADVVAQAAAAVAERFDGVANKLSIQSEESLPIEGDFDALVTVVVNLLDNAWKYSDEPRNVTVAANRRSDRVEITVTDNGMGLAPRAVRKVFDRFYQVDQHLSRSHDGCGLGLSIVKYIVEAHGGDVAVESSLGEGAKFTVSLPACEAAHLPRQPASEPTGMHA